MRPFLLSFFASLSFLASAQYARFTADSVLMRKYAPTNPHILENILKWEWKINGKKLTWGSAPVLVKPHPTRIDTVVFRKGPDREWDTLVCNITHPWSYNFAFNPCCGGFNVDIKGPKKGSYPGVIFTIKNAGTKMLLGTFGESGRILKAGVNDTLSTYCRSAMAPNIYNISLREITPCDSLTACTDTLECLVENDSDTDFKGYLYKKIELLSYFTWMPTGEPVHIIYDAATGRFRVY